jgi:hypothetical protein
MGGSPTQAKKLKVIYRKAIYNTKIKRNKTNHYLEENKNGKS